MRTIQSILLTLIGVVFLASTFAHALAGWPAMSGELAAKSVSAEIGGGLQMGWYFGSIAFLVFSLIVLHQAIRSWKNQSTNFFPVIAIGFGFLFFAGLGFAIRGVAAGYESFAIIGAVTIGAAAIPADKRALGQS
jgi:hypothetical protein